MTTIDAVADTAGGRVRVTYSDAVGGALTRNGTVVRGGDSLTGFGILDDYEAELGVPLEYLLDDATDSVTFLPDVDGSGWLSHPTDPSLTQNVIVQDDSPHDWTSPGSVLPVIGSEWPLAVYSRRSVHNGTLTVLTYWAARDQMKSLLVSGSPLLLRTLPGCKADDQWLWAETVTRTKMGGPASDLLRWEFRYQRVGRPAGDVVAPPANMWAAVVQSHPTWAELVTAHADWATVLTTAHPHA